MAITAWAAKFLDQLDLLVGEGLNFSDGLNDGAYQLILPRHWDIQSCPVRAKFDGCNDIRLASLDVSSAGRQGRRRARLRFVANISTEWDFRVRMNG